MIFYPSFRDLATLREESRPEEAAAREKGKKARSGSGDGQFRCKEIELNVRINGKSPQVLCELRQYDAGGDICAVDRGLCRASVLVGFLNREECGGVTLAAGGGVVISGHTGSG